MCPNDYQIAAWVDGLLNETEKKEITEHINHCPQCLEKVFFLKKTLYREKYFISKKSLLERIVVFFEKELLKIKEIPNNFQSNLLQYSYREENILKNYLEISMEDVNLILEKEDDFLKLTLSGTGECTLSDKNKRILFSGKVSQKPFFLLNLKESYFLSTETKRVELYAESTNDKTGVES